MRPNVYLRNLPDWKMCIWNKWELFGAVDRDPGERVISVAYYALVNVNEYDRKLVRKHNAYWVNINELPPLIFDHPAW